MMYVTAYNISCWYEQRIRMSYKPLKPVQNETYELIDPNNNYKLLVEEVLLHEAPYMLILTSV